MSRPIYMIDYLHERGPFGDIRLNLFVDLDARVYTTENFKMAQGNYRHYRGTECFRGLRLLKYVPEIVESITPNSQL